MFKLGACTVYIIFIVWMFNLEAEQRKLMFFECPVHEGDAMTKVCLDSRCDHSSLLCARCAETNHP